MVKLALGSTTSSGGGLFHDGLVSEEFSSLIFEELSKALNVRSAFCTTQNAKFQDIAVTQKGYIEPLVEHQGSNWRGPHNALPRTPQRNRWPGHRRDHDIGHIRDCLLYTSPSPRD